LLAGHAEVPAVGLATSTSARRKTQGQRRAARREAFRRYFADAPVRRMALRVEGELPPRLLAGLADRAGRDLGLAIVLGSEPAGGTLAVLTPVAKARQLRPGRLALTEDFREVRLATPPQIEAVATP
jgi:polynucleotide 5'-hydroxyl-kinase GRC3/NOL9